MLLPSEFQATGDFMEKNGFFKVETESCSPGCRQKTAGLV